MKDFRAVKTELACYAVIIFAAFLMGFAIKNLYDPVNLVTGGVSGVAIIFKSLFDIPLWLTNTLLNIPLFLAAWRLKGWNFIKRTFIATVSLSVSLYVLPEMTIAGDDIFLSALFGGILSGVGTGILFAVHATTGGTDMLAALLHLKIRQYSVSQIMQVLDAMVVLAGASVFGLGSALYAMIAIYAVCRVSDGILDGLNFSKLAIIISSAAAAVVALGVAGFCVFGGNLFSKVEEAVAGEFKFPDGTTVSGISISGKTYDEAKKLLEKNEES